jgi:hypothetical protein
MTIDYAKLGEAMLAGIDAGAPIGLPLYEAKLGDEDLAVYHASDEWGRQNGIVQVVLRRPKRFRTPAKIVSQPITLATLRPAPAQVLAHVVTAGRRFLDGLGEGA